MTDQNGSSTDVALIIGSGSTGLALAAGLRNSNIRAIVFEKDEGLLAKSRDWNMGLHWGAAALKVLISSEAWDRIQTVQVDPNVPTKPWDQMFFLNSQTGEKIGVADIDHFYRLRRSKLRALLAEDLDVRFNKKLVQLEYSDDGKTVTAKFEDGTSETGRILVGADGARSITRKLIVGSDAALSRRLPFAATFAQAKFTKDQALLLRSWHQLYLAGIHPNNLFSFLGMQYAQDEEAPETWTFFFYISWRSSLEEQDATADWTNDQRLDQVKDLAKQYADPWKSAFEWLPDGHPVWHMGFTDWDPGAEDHKWSNHDGRVTLAGDAAHTMTYQRGQGLNHSMLDAAKLNTAIKSFWDGDQGQDVAVQDYEAEMIERTGLEVRSGTQNTIMLHDWEKALQSPVMRKGLNKNE